MNIDKFSTHDISDEARLKAIATEAQATEQLAVTPHPYPSRSNRQIPTS
jgi:hypothetical protein